MNEIKPIEKLILCGVLRDREHWAQQPWNNGAIHGHALGAYRMQIEEARNGGLARVNLADWIGRVPTATEVLLASDGRRF